MTLLEIAYHNIDPVLVELGPIKIQWYGLSYLATFLIAWRLLMKMQRGGYLRLAKDDVLSLDHVLRSLASCLAVVLATWRSTRPTFQKVSSSPTPAS